MKLIDDLDEYAFRLGLPRWSSFLCLFFYPPTWAILVFRIGNMIYHYVKIPIIRQFAFGIYFVMKRFSEIITGIEIACDAEIGSGIFIAHSGGIVIGTKAKLGDHVSIHQGVTIGGAGRGKSHGSPKIGNCVYLGAGCKVIGSINIGDWVMVGANAVVIKDVASISTVVGVPGKIINKKGSWDYIHFRDKDKKNYS